MYFTNHDLTNTHRFKDSVVTAVVCPGHKAGPTYQACTHVAHHVPVQIGHHHHIELLGLGHQLKTEVKNIKTEYRK